MKKLFLLMMVLFVGGLAGCSDKDDGMLKISSDPGDAEIYIDGERKGNTPAKKGQTFAIKLSEGEHTVEIIKPISDSSEYDQYFGEKTVFVAEKSLQTVSISLEKGQSEAFKEKIQAACDAVTDYKVNGDGTVTDKTTGLMWKQCSEGFSGSSCEKGEGDQYTWNEAIDHAERLSFAKYSDWRLPSKDELLSIVHKECGSSTSPTINLQAFPNAKESRHWSSSPYAINATFAWVVSFYFVAGDPDVNNKMGGYLIRLVRGGQ